MLQIVIVGGPGMREPYAQMAMKARGNCSPTSQAFNSSCFALESQAAVQGSRSFPVAEQAKRADVIQIALAAAFAHRNNMVGIPKATSAGNRLHAIKTQPCQSHRTTSAFERSVCSHRVDLADRATPLVAGEDLIAQIPRIRT